MRDNLAQEVSLAQGKDRLLPATGSGGFPFLTRPLVHPGHFYYATVPDPGTTVCRASRGEEGPVYWNTGHGKQGNNATSGG